MKQDQGCDSREAYAIYKARLWTMKQTVDTQGLCSVALSYVAFHRAVHRHTLHHFMGP